MAFPDYDYDVYEDFEDALGGDWSESDAGGVIDPQSAVAKYYGSQGCERLWTGGVAASVNIDFTGAPYTAVSYGFWYKTPAAGAPYGLVMLHVHNSTNPVVRIYIYNMYLRMRGVDWTETTITLSGDTWYWLTVKV